MKKFLSTLIAMVTLMAVMLSAAVPAFAADLSKDGEYSVNVYLVQKEKDQDTPASDGVLKQAKIVVKDGKATMFIYTQPVTITMITSSLKALTVFKNDDASDAGYAAKVVSKDSKGNPSCFSFELPHTRNFIRIKVDTGLKVPGVIGARLKVDWASLKLVKADAVATTKAVTTVSKTEESKPVDSTTAAADESTTVPVETTAVTEVTSAKDESNTAVSENADSAEIATEAQNDSQVVDKGAEDASTDTAQKSSNPMKVIVPVIIAVVVIAAIVIIVIKKKKS